MSKKVVLRVKRNEKKDQPEKSYDQIVQGIDALIMMEETNLEVIEDALIAREALLREAGNPPSPLHQRKLQDIELHRQAVALKAEGITQFTKIPTCNRPPSHVRHKQRRYPLEAEIALPDGWHWSLCYLEPEINDWLIKPILPYVSARNGKVILESRPHRFASLENSELDSFEDWHSRLLEAIKKAEKGKDSTRRRQAAYIKRVICGAKKASAKGQFEANVGLLMAISELVHKFLPPINNDIWSLCLRDAIDEYRRRYKKLPSVTMLCSYFFLTIDEGSKISGNSSEIVLWGAKRSKVWIKGVIDNYGRSRSNRKS